MEVSFRYLCSAGYLLEAVKETSSIFINQLNAKILNQVKLSSSSSLSWAWPSSAPACLIFIILYLFDTWYMKLDIGCLSSDMWFHMLDVLYLIFWILYLKFDIWEYWYLIYGTWCLISYTWYLPFDFWHLISDNRYLIVDKRHLTLIIWN